MTKALYSSFGFNACGDCDRYILRIKLTKGVVSGPSGRGVSFVDDKTLCNGSLAARTWRVPTLVRDKPKIGGKTICEAGVPEIHQTRRNDSHGGPFAILLRPMLVILSHDGH